MKNSQVEVSCLDISIIAIIFYGFILFAEVVAKISRPKTPCALISPLERGLGFLEVHPIQDSKSGLRDLQLANHMKKSSQGKQPTQRPPPPPTKVMPGDVNLSIRHWWVISQVPFLVMARLDWLVGWNKPLEVELRQTLELAETTNALLATLDWEEITTNEWKNEHSKTCVQTSAISTQDHFLNSRCNWVNLPIFYISLVSYLEMWIWFLFVNERPLLCVKAGKTWFAFFWIRSWAKGYF